MTGSTLGSPPPTRGKDCDDRLCPVCARITPAHAGKSGLYQRRARAVRDHPRPRGEKSAPVPAPSRARGSPPPTRGKARPRRAPQRAYRITPAHAGKRQWSGLENGGYQDHPRPCGEKFDARKAARAVKGSPPPMRGKAQPGDIPDHRTGITPAHAGKRVSNAAAIGGRPDHPRPCGEKSRNNNRAR